MLNTLCELRCRRYRLVQTGNPEAREILDELVGPDDMATPPLLALPHEVRGARLNNHRR
jgi:hypothetical protein